MMNISFVKKKKKTGLEGEADKGGKYFGGIKCETQTHPSICR